MENDPLQIPDMMVTAVSLIMLYGSSGGYIQ